MPGQVNPERDESVAIPLDTETVLRALLTTGPAEDDDGDMDASALAD